MLKQSMKQSQKTNGLRKFKRSHGRKDCWLVYGMSIKTMKRE